MSGLSLLLLGAALLVGAFGDDRIAGFERGDVASALIYAAIGLVMAGWTVQQFRGRWASGFKALAVWALLFAGLMGVYTYRFDLHDVAGRILSEVAPGEPTVGSGGEVSFSRRIDGTFIVAAQANGRDLRFVFDTGASTVVLTAESAEKLGFTPAKLNYWVPVQTANGKTATAPVTLDQVKVGSITVQRVRALVARPGVLYENLLGMTFLERLASYEVRRNRLILRGSG